MKKNEIIEYFIVFLIFVCIICFGIGYLRNKLYTKPASSNQINEVPSKDNLVDDNEELDEIDIMNKYQNEFYENFNNVSNYSASTDINSDYIKEMYSLIPDNSFVNNNYTSIPSSDLNLAKKSSVYQNKIVTVNDINKYVLLNATIKEIMMKYYRYLSLNKNVTEENFSESIGLSYINFSSIRSTYKELFNVDIDEKLFNSNYYICLDTTTPGGYTIEIEEDIESETVAASDQVISVSEIIDNNGLTKVEFDDVNKEYYLYNKNNNKEYKHTFKVRDDNSYYYVSTQPVK